MQKPSPIQRAQQSLLALSIGDAFGELMFGHSPMFLVDERALPPGPWRWTDDTAMARCIVRVLGSNSQIDPDALALEFAAEYRDEPDRGYAGGARSLLTAVADGEDWREISQGLFSGQGSYGNGAAMRVAPVGAYFADDLARAADEARKSAEVTHSHPEGVVGAMAVAVAAALRWTSPQLQGRDFLAEVATALPSSRTADRIHQAIAIPSAEVARATRTLGTGDDVAAWDTVPFCVWVAAHYRQSFEEALKLTAGGMGDADTTCAIVAGILAPETSAIPKAWLERAEPVGG